MNRDLKLVWEPDELLAARQQMPVPQQLQAVAAAAQLTVLLCGITWRTSMRALWLVVHRITALSSHQSSAVCFG
jgi:hypothetical protein